MRNRRDAANAQKPRPPSEGVDSVAVASARQVVLVNSSHEYVPRVDRLGVRLFVLIMGPAARGGTGMPARLRWYVGAGGVAGLLVLAWLLPTLDVERIREVGGAIALFAAFVV